MKDKYNQYKLDHQKYIILLQIGNFYITLNQDAIILNKIMQYKIKESTNFLKVGFPLNSLDKVRKKLQEEEINYLVINDGISEKEKFKCNNYDNFLDNVVDYELAVNKVNYITNILKNNLFNDNILEVLNEIERILCKINY